MNKLLRINNIFGESLELRIGCRRLKKKTGYDMHYLYKPMGLSEEKCILK